MLTPETPPARRVPPPPRPRAGMPPRRPARPRGRGTRRPACGRPAPGPPRAAYESSGSPMIATPASRIIPDGGAALDADVDERSLVNAVRGDGPAPHAPQRRLVLVAPRDLVFGLLLRHLDARVPERAPRPGRSRADVGHRVLPLSASHSQLAQISTGRTGMSWPHIVHGAIGTGRRSPRRSASRPSTLMSATWNLGHRTL